MQDYFYARFAFDEQDLLYLPKEVLAEIEEKSEVNEYATYECAIHIRCDDEVEYKKQCIYWFSKILW
jgi:hypothetical protein